MGITWTQTSTLPVMCAPASTPMPAHPTVGLMAVRGTEVSTSLLHGDLFNGGLLQDQRPRTNSLTVRVLPIIGAYGTSVSAFQGSQKPETTAPAGAKASGVPPRGRPV